MNSNISRFSYMIENLGLYSPGVVDMILGTLCILFLVFLIRYGFLYGKGYILIIQEKKHLEEKKQILADLILMKDIQNELEVEIERAMMKGTL